MISLISYLINVYCNNRNKKKKSFKVLEQWVLELQCKKPKALIVVCGDFNISEPPIKHMHEAIQDKQITFRRRHNDGLRESRTDWVLLSQKNIVKVTNHIWNDLSDHTLISCTS